MIVVNHREQELASWRPGNLTLLKTEETITVLEGRAQFWVDGECVELEPDMSIIVPPHSRHGFTNVGAATLHIYIAYSDASVQTEYDTDPGLTYAIGGTRGDRVDAARVRARRSDR
jgi:oxalate decarboxylase/phosphoglucose isomerase-like protein (cupin superfamily)